MEMCYDGTLVMPINYAVMNEDEMTYVEGGAKNVKMSTNFLDKTYCSWYAGMMLRHSEVSGMGQKEIAQELYAHAVCYYWYDPNGNFFKSNPLSKTLHEKGADGIYIDDGGDTFVRKAFYVACWNMC